MRVITRRLLIEGRVQGVGFRWSLHAEALTLGLRGWVRNRSDGRVEALVCGDEDAVNALTGWAHRGPDQARVDRVLFNDEPDDGAFRDDPSFRQRPTL
ncbi:acylphosphatase [Propionivibrio dicarboxylicus]|uniref:Acylphosphatase n=1 Tax=Propionivibrio dicarboxylicus TaxID=83767 RepID=A0A1G8IDU1_9RHOO|nr:acylphosphatase [Propionivibrio dicarboxylicus]SDI17084.1 acylphosphatase [Propionivibrio dicarboxylicus]